MKTTKTPLSIESLGLAKGSARVVTHSEKWATRFQEEKSRILGAIGHIECEVKHIGSTSVLGLSSKPVIDMVVSVAPGFNVDDVRDVFISLGYMHHRPRKKNDTHWFEYGRTMTYYQAYLFERDSHALNRHLVFCRKLSENTEIRDQYAALKQEAEALYGDDPRAYAEHKRRFIDTVVGA